MRLGRVWGVSKRTRCGTGVAWIVIGCGTLFLDTTHKGEHTEKVVCEMACDLVPGASRATRRPTTRAVMEVATAVVSVSAVAMAATMSVHTRALIIYATLI